MLNQKSIGSSTFVYRHDLLHLLNFGMAFGIRLQQLMEEKGITPTELAERTGIALSHISQLRHGQRSPARKTLLKISEAMDVTIDVLLSKTERPAYRPTEFDKEMLLFREEARKFGPEIVRRVRESLGKLYGKPVSRESVLEKGREALKGIPGRTKKKTA